MASAMSRATPITVTNQPVSLHEQRSERGTEDNDPTAWRRVVHRDDVRMTVYDKFEAPDIP
jgi:hypothetical protein